MATATDPAASPPGRAVSWAVPRLGAAALLLVTAVLLTMLGGIPPAGAVPTEPPPPPPPAPGCEWYGELRQTYTVTEVVPAQGSTRTLTVKTVFSSQPDEQSQCSAFWSETYYDDYYSSTPITCYPDQVTAINGSRIYTNVVEGTGSGTGSMTATVTDSGSGPYGFAYGIGATYELTSTVVGTTPCGTSSSTTTFGSSAASAIVDATCRPTNDVVNAGVQSFAGACSLEEPTSYGSTTYERSWRFSRSACDESVDSDGGGVGDCQEFRDLTDASDATDDGGPGDQDQDGVPDSTDNCVSTSNADQSDADGDGVGDACDEPDDRDGDGVLDVSDNCPDVPNSDQADLDTDGTGDACDDDKDGDGLSASLEAGLGLSDLSTDSDGDGIGEATETDGGRPIDTDGDGVIDAMDGDSDGDGRSDADEGVGDEDGDGIPDYRDPDSEVELDLSVKYAYTGIAGLASGGSTVTLSGPNSAVVQQVCFRSTWTGEVKNAKSTAAILWNGVPAVGLDLATGVQGDSVAALTPVAVDVKYNNKKGTILKIGSLSQTVVLSYCTVPQSGPDGVMVATYPLDIQLASVSGVPVEIAHRLDVGLTTSGASYGPYSLNEEDSDGKALQVQWFESSGPTTISVSP